MRIQITAVPELECADAVTDERSLEVTPMFWSPNELANVAVITILSEGGKTLFRGMMKVSGRNGKPSITARTQTVVAKADSKK